MESSLFWKLAKSGIQQVDFDTLDELGDREYYKELLTSAKTAVNNETITDSGLVADIINTNFRASRHTGQYLIIPSPSTFYPQFASQSAIHLL